MTRLTEWTFGASDAVVVSCDLRIILFATARKDLKLGEECRPSFLKLQKNRLQENSVLRQLQRAWGHYKRVEYTKKM